MTYYAFINNNKIDGCGQCQCLNPEIQNIPIDEAVYNNIEHYMWDDKDIVLNPNYDAEQLAKAKEIKYQEANLKAFEYLESGEAVFEFEEGKSIEATDGNIAKLGLVLVNFILTQDYTSTIEWNTKENENVQLNAEQLQVIVVGLQGIQAIVWTVKFPAYNTAIDEAQTVEEVESIVIDYTIKELPMEDK